MVALESGQNGVFILKRGGGTLGFCRIISPEVGKFGKRNYSVCAPARAGHFDIYMSEVLSRNGKIGRAHHRDLP